MNTIKNILSNIVSVITPGSKVDMVSTPDSECFATFGYDDSNLTVDFRKSGKYVYKNVPRQVFLDMTLAASRGKYFNRKVLMSYECSPIS
jgi:hypothetical protein